MSLPNEAPIISYEIVVWTFNQKRLFLGLLRKERTVISVQHNAEKLDNSIGGITYLYALLVGVLLIACLLKYDNVAYGFIIILDYGVTAFLAFWILRKDIYMIAHEMSELNIEYGKTAGSFDLSDVILQTTMPLLIPFLMFAIFVLLGLLGNLHLVLKNKGLGSHFYILFSSLFTAGGSVYIFSEVTSRQFILFINTSIRKNPDV